MDSLIKDEAYKKWLEVIKSKIQSAQIKAAISVNSQLLMFYWELGNEIIEKQAKTSWGDNFLGQLSKDLVTEFPSMKGFSKRNLELMRKCIYFGSISLQLRNKLFRN